MRRSLIPALDDWKKKPATERERSNAPLSPPIQGHVNWHKASTLEALEEAWGILKRAGKAPATIETCQEAANMLIREEAACYEPSLGGGPPSKLFVSTVFKRARVMQVDTDLERELSPIPSEYETTFWPDVVRYHELRARLREIRRGGAEDALIQADVVGKEIRFLDYALIEQEGGQTMIQTIDTFEHLIEFVKAQRLTGIKDNLVRKPPVDFIEEQVDGAKKKLQEIEASLQEFDAFDKGCSRKDRENHGVREFCAWGGIRRDKWSESIMALWSRYNVIMKAFYFFRILESNEVRPEDPSESI